jgi:hypothetical protein
MPTVYHAKKQKDQLRSFVALCVNAKGLLKRHTLKQPKLVHLDKVLFKGCTAHENFKKLSFYDEMTIADKYRSSDTK